MPQLPMMALMPMIGMGAQLGLGIGSSFNRSLTGTTSLPETILGGIAKQQMRSTLDHRPGDETGGNFFNGLTGGGAGGSILGNFF